MLSILRYEVLASEAQKADEAVSLSTNLKEAIYAYLQTKSLLTDLIGTRLSPDVGRQEPTRPYVVFQVVEGEHVTHLLGASPLARKVVMFTAYASTSASRTAVYDALFNVLHTRRNVVQNVTGGSVNIRSFWLLSDPEANSESGDGAEQGDWQCDMSFSVTYVETVPTLP